MDASRSAVPTLPWVNSGCLTVIGVIEEVDGGRHQRIAQFFGKLVEAGCVEQAGIAPAHGVGNDPHIGQGLRADLADLALQRVGCGARLAHVLVPLDGHARGFLQREGGLLLSRQGARTKVEQNG